MPQQHYRKAYGGSTPENYERYFVPAIGTPLARDLMKVVALRPGERVLDVACGTGVVAQVDEERRGSLERDVAARWQEFVKDSALMLQVHIVVATARK